jgi:hypothetical protein
MWLFAKQLTEYSVRRHCSGSRCGNAASLPGVGLYYGLHEWTERMFGFGARSIALIDAATASPFAQLSMIPLLTLIAFYAPLAIARPVRADGLADEHGAGRRPVADQVSNHVFVVERGQYGESRLIAGVRHRSCLCHPDLCHSRPLGAVSETSSALETTRRN